MISVITSPDSEEVLLAGWKESVDPLKINKTNNYLVKICIKRTLCSFGEEVQIQNFNMYNIIEVMRPSQEYVFCP